MGYVTMVYKIKLADYVSSIFTSIFSSISYILIQCSTQFVASWLTSYMSTLDLVMNRCRICYKSLPEPVISYNYNCYKHIEAETKWPPFSRRHFEMHFLNEIELISIKISLKFVPKGPINNIPALVQIMAWRRPGDKPLPETITLLASLLTYICVARSQWVN